jgi:ATP-dependent DNA helicase MPH1
LALTATPGADVQRVQSVVDALHISRIEIREAEAPEIKKYMNEKVSNPSVDATCPLIQQKTEKHSVPMGSVIDEFSNRWADIMRV